jgi:hypothetical protein
MQPRCALAPSQASPQRSPPSSQPKLKRQSGNKSMNSTSQICLLVVPDESAAERETVPALRRSRMILTEDVTVFHIKRQIVEEVCPGLSTTQIDVRTPSGLLLGQDHSLRFVRTVLWPPSKGELVLKYSRGKSSLL